ncbi:MAG: hypothetical protein ACTHLX_10725 [Candidatus Binatia bacterium]
MQSKLFLAAKLVGLLALAFLLFLPTAEGIQETVLRSDTPVQASSANLNSQAGERMMSFAEAISKNSYNSSLRLPDPSIMLFVGIALVGLAIWARRRAKRTAR